jgi:hypothetical protein
MNICTNNTHQRATPRHVAAGSVFSASTRAPSSVPRSYAHRAPCRVTSCAGASGASRRLSACRTCQPRTSARPHTWQRVQSRRRRLACFAFAASASAPPAPCYNINVWSAVDTDNVGYLLLCRDSMECGAIAADLSETSLALTTVSLSANSVVHLGPSEAITFLCHRGPSSLVTVSTTHASGNYGMGGTLCPR